MMRQTKDGVLVNVRVRPDSGRFALAMKDGKLTLEVTSQAKEGKANLDIVKWMRRMLRKHVEIVNGAKSKDKVLLIVGAKTEDVEKAIESKG